jgi:MSHA pilin protein MshD
MPMTSAAHRGSTLIELLFFIVVVSIGVVGILSVMNTTVRFSAEPMARKQAIVLAESILEEVIQKDYADTDLLDPSGSQVHEKDTSRDTIDDVDDYKDLTPGLVESIFTDLPAGYDMSIVVEEGAWNVGEGDWGLDTQEVSAEDLPEPVPVPLPLPVPAKKITVTVTSRGHSISLSGYRADY